MGRRRPWVVVVVLAAAIAAVFVARRLYHPREAESGAAVETEVAVHTGRITKATLHRYVTAYGRVMPEPPEPGAPPAGMILGSQVAGLLVGIDCSEGDRVARGDTLFRLDSRVAEVDVAGAQKALDFAEQTLQRQQKLLPVDGTSRKALLEAEQQRDAAASDLSAAQTRLALTKITAPLSGTVTRIRAKLGQSVDSGTDLAEIVDLDRLVVSAGVPSAEAPLLRKGQPVELGPDRPSGARVSYVGSEVDPATDTVQMRAMLPAKSSYRPGRFIELRVVVGEHEDRLVVPEESLVSRAGEGAWIYLVEGDRAVRRPVTPGLRERGLVEVEGEGLSEGTVIVTKEAYSLPPETKIRILDR